MKKLIVMSCLSFATAFQCIAQDNSRGANKVNQISDQMIRDLRLNNYQATRLRAINQENINRMLAVEDQYANNPDLIEKACKGICKERDKKLEAFLSSEQYSRYFASRNQYYKSIAHHGNSARNQVASSDRKSDNGANKSAAVSKTVTIIQQDDTK